MDGQQKAFSAEVFLFGSSHACTHTHTLKSNLALKHRIERKMKEEIKKKEVRIKKKQNKRRAETEEMSLSVRERHEWAGALIIDRMIKADEEGFFPQ